MAPSCPALPVRCHCVTKVIAAIYYRHIGNPGSEPKSVLNPIRIAGTSQAQTSQEIKQAHRKSLALALLIATFLAVIVKDRDFWFSTDEPQNTDLAQPIVAQQIPSTSAPVAATATRPVAAPAKKHAVAATVTEPKPTTAPGAAIERKVLPPLEVEVIAGDSHRRVSPGSNALKVEVIRPGSSNSALTAKLAAPTNAAQVEPVNATHPATGSFDGTYPLLAQQMKVQGSVVLQALIGADGIVENLRVLNGPAILASAARQAVSEWRFKPIYENGQAVESKATITVNFTIKVADGATTVASLHPQPDLVISMAE